MPGKKREKWHSGLSGNKKSRNCSQSQEKKTGYKRTNSQIQKVNVEKYGKEKNSKGFEQKTPKNRALAIPAQGIKKKKFGVGQGWEMG